MRSRVQHRIQNFPPPTFLGPQVASARAATLAQPKASKFPALVLSVRTSTGRAGHRLCGLASVVHGPLES